MHIERLMRFEKGFISCTNCACNYGDKVYCQIWQHTIDPTDRVRNMERAESCVQWIPEGLDRSKVITPNVERSYETDNAA